MGSSDISALLWREKMGKGWGILVGLRELVWRVPHDTTKFTTCHPIHFINRHFQTAPAWHIQEVVSDPRPDTPNLARAPLSPRES
ncbi:hypothetical protein JTE90_016262 [Oedothorax gibbosus]|uniref:Uncharacterized protein n=1 Tax=Oedothorax gibbosus TaxID=931172 RepID=A0AAV6VTN8_9ARAC|nr:hypothetical protein JTE90_016262 [Oedothorax gibbosus]